MKNIFEGWKQFVNEQEGGKSSTGDYRDLLPNFVPGKENLPPPEEEDEDSPSGQTPRFTPGLGSPEEAKTVRRERNPTVIYSEKEKLEDRSQNDWATYGVFVGDKYEPDMLKKYYYDTDKKRYFDLDGNKLVKGEDGNLPDDFLNLKIELPKKPTSATVADKNTNKMINSMLDM